MVEFTTLIAWVAMLGIPALIIGFGAMINENKATLVLAFINLITLMGYFMYKGYISDVFIILTTIILAFIAWFNYKSLLRSDS